MIVKFDKFDQYETPALILCSPSSFCFDGVISNPVGEIPFCSDIEFAFNFNDKSTLNFRVNLAVKDSKYYDIDRVIYDKILKHMYVFVEDVGYFRIDDISEYQSENANYKDVTATSCEAELSSRGIPYIPDGTYPLRTVLGMLNAQVAQWDLSSPAIYFDEDLEDTEEVPFQRTFTDVDIKQNVFDFMINTLQELYECVFIFDTVYRKVSVYARSNYKNDTSVHLTKNDVVSHLTAKETDAGAYSVLSGFGDSDLTFSAVNPLGISAIFNFSYYLSWMPADLSAKVEAWQESINAAESDYYTGKLQYEEIYAEKLELEKEKSRLESLKDVYTSCRTNIYNEQSVANVAKYNDSIEEENEKIDIIAGSDEVAATITALDGLISGLEGDIVGIETDIATADIELETLQASLDAIAEPLKLANAFTTQEFKQLSNYMFEGTYTNDNIIQTDIMTVEEKLSAQKELYKETKAKLREISFPVQDFDIDTDDFLFVSKFYQWTSQVETGATIYVETIDDEIRPLYITAITINYEDQNANFKFCSSLRDNSNRALFKSVFDKVASSATSVRRI